MEITKDTHIADILEEYGDIADVMELFGVKRVSSYSLRSLAAKALTVARCTSLLSFNRIT